MTAILRNKSAKMTKSTINLILVVLFTISNISCTKTQNQELKLWYNKPAREWMTEALPIGNGYMGAMFFGGVEKEQIQFTEGSLWSGGPGSNTDYNFGIREGAWKNIEEIRNLIKEGKLIEANLLASNEITGSNENQFGAQQTMGDLFISVEYSGVPTNYKRELDLNKGEGSVSYVLDGEKYKRTYFGYYPGKVMVYNFNSSCKASYSILFQSPHKMNSEDFVNGIYSFKGEVKENGMEFESCLKFDTDGKLDFIDGKMQITNAKNLTIYQVAATDYTLEYPNYKGADYIAENKKALESLEGKSYKEVRKEHLEDYQNLFSRVELNLGENNRDSVPTDRRLSEYADGTFDLGLEEIYFQYSRYLMISASRKGTMPLNLQGKWNNSTNPPWACDYHMNINEEMLYWPAEVTNLGECHLPIFTYMESLVEPGKNSAKEFFNTRGWIVNTMNNPFGYTSPGWGFQWGFFPAGAAWLCQHAWEHYDFTRDESFLKETAYPLMKEAALFWIDYLIEDEKGYLVSCPSYSPEHGGISGGAAMDHQIAWDLLNNCVQASDVLGIDDEFKQIATVVRNKILPPQIGDWGQLQEWKEDVDDPNDNHRHVSHLFALYPGKQITVEHTPELAEAAKVSLKSRGDGGTGWSLAWKVNFWARLKDGDHAYLLLQRLLRPSANQGMDYVNLGGSYSNLLCAHPPFQLDGNMGGCAGIAEMLLQSHDGIIELLPALPLVWKRGEVKGLVARGGFVIDIKWENNELLGAKIKSLAGREIPVKYKDKTFNVSLHSGEEIILDKQLKTLQ